MTIPRSRSIIFTSCLICVIITNILNWCWNKEDDKLTDHARNEELLHKVKEETNIPHKIQIKSDRIGHILCRNCLLKRIIDG